jgi:DNA polymerase-3 subunit delta'
MRFAQIPGRAAFKQRLIASVKKGKIPHAQLFSGQAGTGSLALALAYVQYIFCQNPSDNDSCGECASCSKVAKLSHPDLHFTFPTAAKEGSGDKNPGADSFMPQFRKFISQSAFGTNEDWEKVADYEKKKPIITVEEARRLIVKLSLKSFEGGYKVMIIWLPEKMNINAANALLKLLEEPPDKTLLLLVTEDPSALLPTILSRVIRYEIPDAEPQEIADWLIAELPDLDKENVEQIAQVANGSLREAMRLAMDAEENYMVFFRDWMRACYKKDFNLIISQMMQFSELNKEKQKACLLYGISKFRDTIFFSNGTASLVKASASDMKFSQDFAKVMKQSVIQDLIQKFEAAHYAIERNANAKIQFMNISYHSIIALYLSGQKS